MTEPSDLWRETVHRGVQALGFREVTVFNGPWMAAEIARQDLAPSVKTAACAAIEMDKQIAHGSADTPAGAARMALQAALATSPAAAELSAYQALLTEILCRAVAHDPALALEAMAEPYE